MAHKPDDFYPGLTDWSIRPITSPQKKKPPKPRKYKPLKPSPPAGGRKPPDIGPLGVARPPRKRKPGPPKGGTPY